MYKIAVIVLLFCNSCYSHMAFRWPLKSLPVKCFHQENAYWETLYNSVARDINSAVGFTVLDRCDFWVLTPMPEIISQSIVFKVREIESLGLAYRWVFPGTNKLAAVKIEVDPDNSKLHYSVMYHELGHALGLMHDTYDKESAMYPFTGGRKKEFQNGDIDLLIEAYKGE